MAKSDVSRMEGSPWHVGYLKMNEWDSRRDKRDCNYFHENHCKIHNERCIGSSHCPEYKTNKKSNTNHKPSPAEWQKVEKEPDSIPGLVQQNDAVTIFCAQTNQSFTFVIPNGDAINMAPVKAQCIGKHLHDKVFWNGYQYEITNLKKVK